MYICSMAIYVYTYLCIYVLWQHFVICRYMQIYLYNGTTHFSITSYMYNMIYSCQTVSNVRIYTYIYVDICIYIYCAATLRRRPPLLSIWTNFSHCGMISICTCGIIYAEHIYIYMYIQIYLYIHVQRFAVGRFITNLAPTSYTRYMCAWK